MKKILIIDDDVDIIDLVSNRLKKNNYDVIFANDGDNGIRKALEHRPDLIIIDVMMPRLPGPEAVKLLKSYEQTQHIPILFFTAMNSYLPTEVNEINVNGQFYPAIPKPFEPNKLLASVKLLLGEQ
ncbi:MAG: response regulator [Candidatus Omnitrophica bacterium]|nr:response regulator [Candidatus Omnitrophota bacterium]MDE2223047.1 response regulator [Candidatus Omnitrophota bacterium]